MGWIQGESGAPYIGSFILWQKVPTRDKPWQTVTDRDNSLIFHLKWLHLMVIACQTVTTRDKAFFGTEIWGTTKNQELMVESLIVTTCSWRFRLGTLFFQGFVISLSPLTLRSLYPMASEASLVEVGFSESKTGTDQENHTPSIYIWICIWSFWVLFKVANPKK